MIRERDAPRLSERTRYYGGGLLVLAVNYCSVALAGLVNVFTFTWLGSRELYGSFAYALAFLAIASLFSLPGAGDALAYCTAKGYEGSLGAIARHRLRFSAGGTLFLFAVAAYFMLLTRGQQSQQAGISLIVLGVLFPGLAPSDTYLWYLQAKRSFLLYAGSVSSVAWLTTGATATALATGSPLPVVVGTYALAQLVANWFFFGIVYRRVKAREVHPDTASLVRRFSRLGLLASVSNQADRLVLGSWSGMSVLGAYHFADRLAEPMRATGSFAAKLIFPRVSRQKAAHLGTTLRRFPLLIVGGLALGACLIVFAVPPIVCTVFPGYADTVWLVQVLLAANLCTAVGVVLSAVLQSQQALHRRFFLVNAVSYAGRIVLVLTLGLLWQIEGVAVGRVIVAVGGAAALSVIVVGIARGRMPTSDAQGQRG